MSNLPLLDKNRKVEIENWPPIFTVAIHNIKRNSKVQMNILSFEGYIRDF
jgi:hypothetical protein